MAASSVSIKPSSATIEVSGSTITLQASSENKTFDFVWKCYSGADCISFSPSKDGTNCEVSGVSIGTATITVIDNYSEDEATATIVVQGAGYSLDYETNGGTLQSGFVNPITNINYIPNPLPNCTKEGYTFNWWFYEPTFLSVVEPDEPLNANRTIYAKFTKNDMFFEMKKRMM